MAVGPNASVPSLFDISAEVELSTSLGENSIQSRPDLGWEVFPFKQSLGFTPNSLERLNKIAPFQLARIVSHSTRSDVDRYSLTPNP